MNESELPDLRYAAGRLWYNSTVSAVTRTDQHRVNHVYPDRIHLLDRHSCRRGGQQ